MSDKIYTLIRLYTGQSLNADTMVSLNESQAHYLKNVMRKAEGDKIRVFNGSDGEWLAELKTLKKKEATIRTIENLRKQPSKRNATHLFFPPLPKTRMDWLIEKSVELDVTGLHPILTQNTEVRKIKEERIQAQIIEAAEQSERLNLPILHPLDEMISAIGNKSMQILAALERFDAPKLSTISPLEKNVGFLIGPAGGFTQEEKQKLATFEHIQPVSLGDNILRAETAALYGLSCIQFTKS